MQSSDELERLRSEIDDLKKDIKVATNSEERTAMFNVLAVMQQRELFLMQGASIRNGLDLAVSRSTAMQIVSCY
jgi:hypothetical protein